MVLGFIDSLNSFAENEFKEKLYELGMGAIRLLFHHQNNFVILIGAIVGKNVPTGRNSEFNKKINEIMFTILSGLGYLLYNDEYDLPEELLGSVVNNIVAAVNKIEKNFPDELNQKYISGTSEDWNISAALMFDETGTPICTRAYDGQVLKDDPMLITSFLSAINSFSKVILKEGLDEIVLSRFRIYFRLTPSKLYATVIEMTNENLAIFYNSNISTYIRDLMKNMNDAIDLMDIDLDDTITGDVLGNIVDSFVFESLLQSTSKSNTDVSQDKYNKIFSAKD